MADDKKGPAGGPKTADSKRDDNVDVNHQAGADAHLSDVRHNQFGDNTSSSSGSNNPGQHGRDGGEINNTTNNPAPSDAAIKGDSAEEEGDNDKEIKKL